MSSNSIIIFEKDHFNIQNLSNKICWDDRLEDQYTISIVNYIEKNSALFKEIFLNLFNQFNKTKINNTYIFNRFVSSNINFWLANKINEKNVFSSRDFFNNMKFLALEYYLESNKIKIIELYSQNIFLIQNIKLLCKKKNIKFINKFNLNFFQKYWFYISTSQIVTTYKNLFKVLIYFIYLIFFKFKLSKEKLNISNSKNILIQNYYLNKHHNLFNKNEYLNTYWGHLFSKINGSYNLNLINILNNDSKKIYRNKYDSNTNFINDKYYLLDLISAFFLYIKFFLISLNPNYNFEKINKIFNFKLSFLRLNYNESLNGINLFKNILYFKVFDNYLKTHKKIDLGIYLYENLCWEKIFIQVWKKNKHRNLIGCAHSTIRYWDLRYYDINKSDNLLFPNIIAINPMDKKTKKFFNNNISIVVEALRYQKEYGKIKNFRNYNLNTILLIGDIDKLTTNKMLECINSLSNKNIKIVFKPHPTNRFKLYDFKNTNLNISENNIHDIINQNNINIAIGSISSTLSELYERNLTLINYLDGNNFNFSTLNDKSNVYYFSNSIELNDILANLKNFTISESEPLFYRNKNLTKWKKLIKENV